MTNSMLTAMSEDMGIHRYCGETDDSFVYRLCYSALGQWCLRTAQNSTGGVLGSTKHSQTIVLSDLIMRFSELFPSITDRFGKTSNQQVSFPVHIRRVYEETGYLVTDNNKHNRIVNYGRSITLGNTSLFFGIPNETYTVNGLGVFSNSTTYKISAKEFLIRDDLTCEEYFESRFDPIDFYDNDIEISELEFFNPLLYNAPSQSWGKRLETDFTLARKTELGPFYRVKRIADALQFAGEPIEQQNDSFTSYEYRRLYFALKAHFNKPLKAIITKYDDMYSKISLGGHLPNREYYFLLLLSWPENNVFDKVNFIIQNDLLKEVITILASIGIKIIGGHANE